MVANWLYHDELPTSFIRKTQGVDPEILCVLASITNHHGKNGNMAEKQKCLTIKTYSFHNVLFETKNNLFTTKLLIICSGSDGNFENIKYNAILLIEKSISALAIGYEKIGVWGISLGSICVLSNGCLLPGLITLVITACSCYFVVQGIGSKKKVLFNASSYSYRSKVPDSSRKNEKKLEHLWSSTQFAETYRKEHL
ncbi:hypothetical protein U3516DRAFT_752844 [Neocallimastix sp. 'constans']